MKTVLLLIPDNAMGEMTKLQLERRSVKVVTDIAAATEIDGVIMKSRPGKETEEMIACLRKKNAHMPIWVVMTASEMPAGATRKILAMDLADSLDEFVFSVNGKNILVVIRDELSREAVVRACMDHDDYEVRSARTLSEADEIRKSFRPDFVFSSYLFTDGTGPSRFPAIRAQNPKVRICLLSANKEEPGHGADKFLMRDHSLYSAIMACMSKFRA